MTPLNRALVALSREAVGTDALIAGDMTTTGEPVLPSEDRAYHRLLDLDVYKRQGRTSLNVIGDASCAICVNYWEGNAKKAAAKKA